MILGTRGDGWEDVLRGGSRNGARKVIIALRTPTQSISELRETNLFVPAEAYLNLLYEIINI